MSKMIPAPMEETSKKRKLHFYFRVQVEAKFGAAIQARQDLCTLLSIVAGFSHL